MHRWLRRERWRAPQLGHQTPTIHRLFLDLPVIGGEVRSDVEVKWAANAPVALVPSHVPNLRQLEAITIDIGTHDDLIPSNEAFIAELERFDIEHTYETYEGDHVARVGTSTGFRSGSRLTSCRSFPKTFPSKRTERGENSTVLERTEGWTIKLATLPALFESAIPNASPHRAFRGLVRRPPAGRPSRASDPIVAGVNYFFLRKI